MLMDRRGELATIDRDACLELLRGRTYGRLGVTSGSQPLVLPINYGIDGEDVVFRTGGGGKFDSLVRGVKAAFEIDEVDEDTHTGWSVLVTGRVEEVVSEAELDRLERECPILPWAPGDRSHWMRLVGERVSGRRI